jgi:GTP pyrophosphokinase
VLTHATQVPRKDWLDFVVTGKARSRIRQAIRAAETARSRELGRDILERELRKAGSSFARLQEQGGLQAAADRFGRGSIDELLAGVGYGRLSAPELVRAIRGEAPEPAPSRIPRLRRPRSAAAGVQVGGQSDVMVRFARCCAPIPGDDVVGFVTRGRGVTVHVADCPKTFELDPSRRIDVAWQPEAEAPRSIKVRVRSEDRPGLLATVTKTIAARGINIGGARITTTPDKLAEHTFEVWVHDVDTLNGVMKELSKIKGVLSVERLRS